MKLNCCISLHPWHVKSLVAKRYSFNISDQLLHIPSGRTEVEKKIRSQSLPRLVSLEAMKGPLRKVSREHSIGLADKGHSAVHCQSAEGTLYPVVTSSPTATRQSCSPPEVNMPVANRLPLFI